MKARLFYVIGPSGSGKDSLLDYARRALSEDPRFCFAHRYITRPAASGGENHIALSQAEFQVRQQARLFAMHWSSHELNYGIGIEINQWLAKGIHVVVNGSRSYLERAKVNYPELIPVWIDVEPEILRQRLLARGRETEAQIDDRLLRNSRFRTQPRDGLIISNNHQLEQAGEQLIHELREKIRSAACA
ncbi:MAG: phosphonate metabolism protein/1,5-bisphosphokinase (PRPP-forming) PhnN [Marinospirillum sp.]|uniref:phosphonate metabolism protein/1,5-bisphosphokinase (PRPP-forming) PhnN n=1 Tax=Marinospirillum sp. TaxID=2183934 RepID=UPI0019EE3BA2|nr:phosphonate metabolism protein/1,5-bisphosphokinase (PRPP-forming) PhnN [Marinospirillum sp.]MBE0507192.1 phosphonate metabolism protein/1,5-bisphosphokinase (PRPP-forming) PhnN [Marinospirillum sp.]